MNDFMKQILKWSLLRILAQIIYHPATVMIDHMLEILLQIIIRQYTVLKITKLFQKSDQEMYIFGKKNIRKAKKIRGETYTSATGNIINAKTFQPIICKCFKKCHNFV